MGFCPLRTSITPEVVKLPIFLPVPGYKHKKRKTLRTRVLVREGTRKLSNMHHKMTQNARQSALRFYKMFRLTQKAE